MSEVSIAQSSRSQGLKVRVSVCLCTMPYFPLRSGRAADLEAPRTAEGPGRGGAAPDAASCSGSAGSPPCSLTSTRNVLCFVIVPVQVLNVIFLFLLLS